MQFSKILNQPDLGVGKNEKWPCDERCNLDDIDLFNSLKSFFEEFNGVPFKSLKTYLNDINMCSNQHIKDSYAGHPLICHKQPLLCRSKFLKLLIVRAHFPKIRTLENYIYSMIRFCEKMNEIQQALITADVGQLLLNLRKQ